MYQKTSLMQHIVIGLLVFLSQGCSSRFIPHQIQYVSKTNEYKASPPEGMVWTVGQSCVNKTFDGITAPTLDAAVKDALNSAYRADTFEIWLVQEGWIEHTDLLLPNWLPIRNDANTCLIVEGIASNSAGKRVESMENVNRFCKAYKDAFLDGYCDGSKLFCTGFPTLSKCPPPDMESLTPDAGRERGLVDGRKANAAERAK